MKFLFYTGCRPSEAVALQWRNISSDLRLISFQQALIETEDGRIVREGLKTQERRKFPCNDRLQALLASVKPEGCKPNALVFPSIEGTYINTNNLRNRAYKRILAGLGIQYRKLYQTRHTFITLALESGLDAKDVARLVGNSPEVIYRHYAGNKRDLFLPIRDCLKSVGELRDAGRVGSALSMKTGSGIAFSGLSAMTVLNHPNENSENAISRRKRVLG